MGVPREKRRRPQGLQPAFSLTVIGTAEAVPFPKPILERHSLAQLTGNSSV